MTDSELDAVPTDAIEIASLEDGQEWLAYSLFVLQPRGQDLERRARRLMFNPLLYPRWRRAQRAWEANTARMEAILDAHRRFLAGTSSRPAILEATTNRGEEES